MRAIPGFRNSACQILLLLTVPLLLLSPRSRAQNDWKIAAHWNVGANVWMTWGKKQAFPGLKIFAALSLSSTYKDHLLLNYGPSLSIYTKSLGANLNPLAGDVQIDFTNSFSFGYTWGDTLQYQKNLRTVHTGDYYNVVTDRKNFFLLSSNIILNNHKRNQVVGSTTFSLKDVTLNYYNDGPPFNLIPLGDNFDRYWTGGGGIIVHRDEGFNLMELSFDQFTGYTPQLYELANIIGINVPLYPENNQKIPTTFNTSAYQLKIGIDRFLSVDAGVIGNMVTRQGKFFGIQDIIHIKGNHSLHPNYDDNRFFLGGTYLYPQKIKL